MKFLLEIGVEEVPDWMLRPATDHLRTQIEQLISPWKAKIVLAEATPRRLAVIADKLPAKEADRTEAIKGPPASAPQQAVDGFARKHGVDPSALGQSGGYFLLEKKTPGRPVADILAAALPNLILGIPWPKTMLWPAKGGARFIRPIRWLVCLLGQDVVRFEINGIESGAFTRGHRQMGRPKPIKVSIATYEKALARNGVILRASDRRKKLIEEVGQESSLIDLHVYLNEYPSALRGAFDATYLSLPEEVLETVMRHHQKYFAVRGEDGHLKPEFIAVMNRADDPEGLIRHGHERVLRARFNDARFFYDFDQKRTLEQRVEDLKNVTFHKELGSYFDKTERMIALCDDADTRRAAMLSKADLTTEMVKEFTELQGIVGGRYAEAQGESPAVAKAIYEHYQPLSMDDAIPSTRTGQVVALADKLDTLREMFRIGQIPTGSKDPFALRRAAQGIVRILAEGEIDSRLSVRTDDPKLREFLEDRLRYYFRDVKGFAYDEVNAVLTAGYDDVKDVAKRLQALKSVRSTENFEPLAAGFKRIKNILRQANFSTAGKIREDLLEAGPERELYEAKQRIQLTGDYASDLAAIASLRPAIDLFFDKVMVNVPDAATRENRLTLLFSLFKEFSSVADFSEIVTSQ